MGSDFPRSVEFPEVGPDVGLQFKYKDCMKLQDTFGQEWFDTAYNRLAQYDLKVIGTCLEIAGKKDGVSHKIDAETAVDAVGAEDVALRLIDALYLSVKRKSFKEIMEEAKQEAKKLLSGDSGPPLDRPATSSQTSTEKPKESGFSGQIL